MKCAPGRTTSPCENLALLIFQYTSALVRTGGPCLTQITKKEAPMKRIATAVGLSILLAACGGGGDDSAPAGGGSAPAAAPPVAAGTAEGFWQGKSSTGSSVALAVLENGETWGLYSQGGYIVGAIYGKTTSTGGTKLSGSGLDFNIPSRSVTQGSYSGTFEAKGSVDRLESQPSAFIGLFEKTAHGMIFADNIFFPVGFKFLQHQGALRHTGERRFG